MTARRVPHDARLAQRRAGNSGDCTADLARIRVLGNDGDERDPHVRQLPHVAEDVDVPDEEVLAEIHVAKGDADPEGKNVENEGRRHAPQPGLDEVGIPVQRLEHDRLGLSPQLEVDALGAFVGLALESLDRRDQDGHHVALTGRGRTQADKTSVSLSRSRTLSISRYLHVCYRCT